jgi:hypothetical protein
MWPPPGRQIGHWENQLLSKLPELPPSTASGLPCRINRCGGGRRRVSSRLGGWASRVRRRRPDGEREIRVAGYTRICLGRLQERSLWHGRGRHQQQTGKREYARSARGAPPLVVDLVTGRPPVRIHIGKGRPESDFDGVLRFFNTASFGQLDGEAVEIVVAERWVLVACHAPSMLRTTAIIIWACVVARRSSDRPARIASK